MAFELKPLPYDAKALEPYMSERTLMFHHGKHHQGYVDKLNGLIEGTELEKEDLETIIRAARDRKDQGLFNNAGQTWNHEFFWNSMAAKPSDPPDDLAEEIERAFEGRKGFRKAFRDAATGQFGSGWAWLVAGGDGLEIMSTANADLPLMHGKTPLICCDVWEHAYYLDYQNARGEFVDAYLDYLINWEFAARNWLEFNQSSKAGKRTAAA